MDGMVNPAMLALARESQGLSQGDMAALIGVTQGKISKYENGMLQVSDEDLNRIANALGFTAEFFFQKDKVYGLGSSFLFNRRKQSAPILVQKRVQSQVNILRMQIDRLLKSVELEPTQQFEPLDVDEYDGDIELIAEVVRAKWQVPIGQISSVTALIESAGGMVLLCDFGTADIDAAHLWLPGLPPLFFLNHDMPGERMRLTLAHEVGHAFMHRNPVGDAVEDEANRFAGAFLMPRKEIAPHLTGLTLEKAASLKAVWGVSMQAIVMRAKQLGCIPDSRYRRLFTSLSAQGYRKNEPFPIPREEPAVLKQLVEFHRTELGYDDFDLAKLLFAPDPQFFAASVKPAVMSVDGAPFFAFFPRRDGESDTGFRLVM